MPGFKKLLLVLLCTLLVISQAFPIEKQGPLEHQALARQILRSAGIKTGLCVHLGCEDGKLTAALGQAGKLLVHGLALDRNSMESARQHLESKGVYGQVSVDSISLERLPYADNLVNLLIADDLPVLLARKLSLKEVMRVLCPDGIAYLGQSLERRASGKALTEEQLKAHLSGAGIKEYQIMKLEGVWAKVRKPRPQGMNEWTHKSYDASGNCVSQDEAIAPLYGLRWIAGPVWPMGSGYQVSNGGIVSANGRIFSITLNLVENIKKTPQQRDREWFLVARDAYNGMLLWQRPFQAQTVRDGQELAKGLVAIGERVYAVIEGNTVALDAATGKTVGTLVKDTPVGTKLFHLEGKLVVASKERIRALEAASGEVRWEKQYPAQDIVAGDSRLFFTTPHQRELVCLDLHAGKERWRSDLGWIKGFKKQLLFYQSGVAILVWELNWQKGHNGIAAFDAKDGRRLWHFEYMSSRATWANAVWFVDGLIWHRIDKAGLQGLHPLSGKVIRSIVMQGGYSGGCSRDIATSRYVISTRPLNFFDWKDGNCHGFRGGRHACRAGVIVANGLLYTLPHGCKCVRESLRGHIAFAPAADTDKVAGAIIPAAQLEGAAETRLPGEESHLSRQRDWPTFRHNPWRTSSTKEHVPARLELLWQVQVNDQHLPGTLLANEWLANPLGGDRLTAPVVADGMVFVGVTDEHRLVALDGNSGKPAWSFTVGGRLDTPPTIYKGFCLVGAHDGWVYCLRASDGELLWRFRAAPYEERILAFGQLESPWPVIGGVLVEDDIAYFVAGRSSAVDGGIYGYALEVAAGKVVWTRKLEAPRSDILVREGDALRIAGGGSGGIKFDLKTGGRLPDAISPQFRWNYGGKIGSFWGGANRAIDRSWRVLSVNETASHWMRIKQGYGPHEGQLVIAAPDRERFFAYRFKQVHWSKAKDASTEFGGNLLAWKDTEQLWSVEVPQHFQVEALVLAGDVLFAAGPVHRFHRSEGAKLWALSAEDGKKLSTYELHSPPVCEGMAVAGGRLYLATQDGKLLCFGKP